MLISSFFNITIFIRINTPGGEAFLSRGGGGATILGTKKQLSSPVIVGDNGQFKAFFLIGSMYNCQRALN